MEEGQDAVVWISERSIAKRTYLPRDPPKRRKGPNRKKKKKKNHMQLLGPGPRQHDDKEVELTGEIGGLEATAEGGLRPGAEATAGRTQGLEATAEGTGGQSHCREDSGAGWRLRCPRRIFFSSRNNPPGAMVKRQSRSTSAPVAQSM